MASAVLVTGANRGIGLELVRRYAEDGWRVVATCRDVADAAELQEIARSCGVAVESLDLADDASIVGLGERLEGQPLDVVINNAGTMGPLPLEEHIHRQRFGGIDYDLWADILRVNTLGTVHLTEVLLPNVEASLHKKVVVVSSTAGSIGGSDRTAIAYTTSKAALNKATTIMARTLAPQGITVVALCPGHVKTRLGIGGASLEIDDSVKGIVRVIDGLTVADAGRFLRYNGESIPW